MYFVFSRKKFSQNPDEKYDWEFNKPLDTLHQATELMNSTEQFGDPGKYEFMLIRGKELEVVTETVIHTAEHKVVFQKAKKREVIL